MIRSLAIFALLATCGLHAAIKKAQAPQPAQENPAAKPPGKPSEGPQGGGLLEELRKRSERDGGRLRMDAPEFADLLRSMLEKQGVPGEQLKNASVIELLKLLREKNPDGIDGLQFGLQPFNKKLQKQLSDHFLELLDGHRPGTVQAATATFAFRDGRKPGDPLAFGTAVNADGWLLTKASEVKGAAELQCEIKGAWLAAKDVASNR